MTAPSTKRFIIIELNKQGHSNETTIRLLKTLRQMVSHHIKLFKEVGSTSDRSCSGRSKTFNVTRAKKIIKMQIKQNSKRSIRKIAQNLDISYTAVRSNVRKDLKLMPYKLQNFHDLTPNDMAVRVQRCKQLLQQFPAGTNSTIVIQRWEILRCASLWTLPSIVKTTVLLLQMSLLPVQVVETSERKFIPSLWWFEQPWLQAKNRH